MAVQTQDRRGKLLTVSQMAERLGVRAHALRYYESEGLVTPRRTSGGQRRYLPEDESQLRALVELRDAGVPLAQLRIYTQLRDECDATAQRLELLLAHEARLRIQLATVRRHLRAAEQQHARHRSESAT